MAEIVDGRCRWCGHSRDEHTDRTCRTLNCTCPGWLNVVNAEKACAEAVAAAEKQAWSSQAALVMFDQKMQGGVFLRATIDAAMQSQMPVRLTTSHGVCHFQATPFFVGGQALVIGTDAARTLVAHPFRARTTRVIASTVNRYSAAAEFVCLVGPDMLTKIVQDFAKMRLSLDRGSPEEVVEDEVGPVYDRRPQ